MKKLFITYAIIAISFFAYITILLIIYSLEDQNYTYYELIQLVVITFALPIMILVWFPMRILCAYRRKKSNENKDNLDTIPK